MTAPNVASPLSTGGAGTFFEQHVVAYWLTQLLVRAIPPIHIDSNVVEVALQTEHLGWRTDDFLVSCEGPGDIRRLLAGQVKRTFTVSAANEDCKKAILDFWADFQSDRFSHDRDRLVLVVQRGTDVLLRDFVGLLECARATRDGAELLRRLSTSGVISKKAVHYCEEIGAIVGEHEGRKLDAGDLWSFLRVLHVLSLDLDTSTRQTEAQFRSLLAYTTTDGETSKLAGSSWQALLELASTAMQQARTLRRQDLPEELQRRHGVIGSSEERMLRALREHTAPILRRIRSTIGPSLHLERAAITQKVLDEVEATQVVIVSGPAGYGKSAIGKEIASRLALNHFVFGFRVEEFAQAHIDATLHAAQIPGNAESLAAILSAQPRKLILIESVERLLERSTRDAFTDLMAHVATDPNMRLLLTCRDYSTEQVRASFLRPSGLTHSVITVPPLDEAELAEVAQAVPRLSEPLRNERLRSILRNPYFLDMALAIPWPAERPVPQSEREFRAMFWSQTVRREAGPLLGLARRREETLQLIAVRRARALSEYIPVNNLDPEAVASLRQDSLIVSPENTPALVATAHDVLEDWSILQWLDELHLAESKSLQDLSAAIGTHPAVRRSYRKWIAELLEREPAAADRLFEAATSNSSATAQFRDDTLVSLLRAPSAPELLTRHEVQLRAKGNVDLKRVIHLLRVACVTTPDWLQGASGYGSMFNVPDGPAWIAVLKLVRDGWQQFTADDQLLLLGLIEDAVRGVSWRTSVPDGAEFIAGIAYNLLPDFRGYRTDDARARLLKVIAKIPSADPASFESVLRGAHLGGEEEEGEDERRLDRVASELRGLLYTGMEGAHAARDLPELTSAVAADYLLTSEETLDKHRYRSYEVDIHFGFVERLRSDFFPASALRGPWFTLLQLHPQVALELYFKAFNHSIDWYVHPRVGNPLEAAFETELAFADGTRHKQWANGRLWVAYRGISVSPYAYQSMLMALEKWLLGFAQAHPAYLDELLLKILRRSHSASISAVVASVATASPHSAGETLLVLLSATDFIRLDRERMVQEGQASALNKMFPELDPEKKIYRDERETANRLPHRRLDLEWAVANLQLGPLGARVHAILDQHLAALPKIKKRDQSQLALQLAIQRMDLRQYDISVATKAAPDGCGNAGGTYMQLEPKITDPALQAMVEQSAAKQSALNDALTLWMWGVRGFKREMAAEESGLWREVLAKARTRDRESDDDIGARNGPGVVAAVCIRDHWAEMSEEDREWCSDVACSEVMRHADNWNHTVRIQRHDMAADRACASVMPVLLTSSTSEPMSLRVRTAVAAAITHPVDEVRWFATWGVNAHVWAADRAIALRCIHAIAAEAGLLEQVWKNFRRRPTQPGEVEALLVGATKSVRESFWQVDVTTSDAHVKLSLAGYAEADAMSRVLTILAFVPEHPLTVAAFEQASLALVDVWSSDNRGGDTRQFESEQVISKRMQEFVMRATRENAARVLRPILHAVDEHDREVHSFVQGLTSLEDSSPNTPQYWYLWSSFAEKVRTAKWVQWLHRKHATGSGMLAAMFLTMYWKDNVRHWRSLEGYGHHVDALFEALPPASIVLDDYLRFLYHVGERSLPEAFVRIARSIQRGKAIEMLVLSNTVFLLEVLLQRHVYGRPLELKKSQHTREAVLFLLDVLVESGSSAAFRMRDDFVTPAA